MKTNAYIEKGGSSGTWYFKTVNFPNDTIIIVYIKVEFMSSRELCGVQVLVKQSNRKFTVKK